MSQPPDESIDELPQVRLPKLDARPGPAPWLSAKDTSRLVAATLRVHQNRRASSMRRMWQLAAALALFLGLTAGVSAMLFRSNKQEPAPRSSSEPFAVESATEVVSDTVPAEQAPPEISQPRVPGAARTPATPADLLSRANQLRSQGHWHRAAQTYGQAIRFAPHSAAAYAATIAAANLYNEKLQEPQRALRLFQRALQAHPSGPLSEEAHWGMAQAYRHLRRRKSETAALRMFLRHHPQSALAPEAQRRLQSH